MRIRVRRGLTLGFAVLLSATTDHATLEDFYGDSGKRFQAALSFYNREPNSSTVLPNVNGYGIGVDDMFISWKETRLDEDTTSCAGECADLVEQGEEAWRDRARLALGRIHAFDGDLAAAREIATAALARQDSAGDRWEGAIFCALLGFVELSVPDAPTALGWKPPAPAPSGGVPVTGASSSGGGS